MKISKILIICVSCLLFYLMVVTDFVNQCLPQYWYLSIVIAAFIIIIVYVVWLNNTLRRAYAELHSEKDKLQHIFESMTDGIYLVDRIYDIEYVNPALTANFGTYEGVKCYTYFHDRKEVCPWCKNKDVFAGKTVRWEWYSQKKGKTYDLIGTPLKNSDGVIVSKLEIFRDITNYTKALEALRNSEKRYSSLVEQAVDGIFLMNDDARILNINQIACNQLGYSKKELLKLGVSDIDPSFVPDKHIKKYWKPLESGKFITLETTFKRKNGSEFPVEVRLGTININTEKQYMAIVRDISENKRTEEERNLLISAIEQAAEIVIIIDIKRTIQYVNPAFEHITGYSKDEAIGQSPNILESGKQDEAFYKDVWDTLTSGETWKGKFINKKKNGTLYTEDVTISPVLNASGKIVNYVGVGRDISNEIALENQLRQAQKMEAVGLLAGGVAHDFNNILQAIFGYVELAQFDLSPDDDKFKDLEQIYISAKKAAALTRQLLAFSRQQIIEPIDIDLNNLIDGLLKMIRRVIGEHIEIDFIAGHHLGVINADPGQIEQILMNLCVNARDAMPNGGKLAIETENVLINGEYCKAHYLAKAGQYVMLSVTDTGSGMDKETMRRIFEPFFTTKEIGKGTGLGLATTYGIVKQHNGMINVYSEVGNGTTFKIYFPLIKRLAAEIGNKIEVLAKNGTETILVAEDDETIRIMITRILKSAGYKVFAAENGQEAVELFKTHSKEIALALLDVIMPNMGGKEACEQIHKIDPNIRIIYTSGYSVNGIHTHFVLDEGTKLIQKPYNPQTLLRKIREVLDKTKGGQTNNDKK